MAMACRALFALGVCLWVVPACAGSPPQARIVDLKHHSTVFGEERSFRVFLPLDYDRDPKKRYPVVYFFHGWHERYNRSDTGYDSGDTYGGDTIAAFVANHDLIVVKWDGYNPRTPGEDYPRPYNVSPVETKRQFPLYFPELVRTIDSQFRTIADREHRATSGLSMGGFMSFWVAGKYPDLVGSASNFMGSTEFEAGPNGFPVEYRHREMYGNYEGLRTRLVMGTKDFIRWYHAQLNAVWDYTRLNHEHETFEWDHGTPGIAKTLSFHMAAFEHPLPKPSVWSHADVYSAFEAWGYSVSSDRRRPGFTVIENASTSGFRSYACERLPDGARMPSVTLHVATSPAYRARRAYNITDINLESGSVTRSTQTADSEGRLHIVVDGARHEVGITVRAQPVLTVSGWEVASGPWAVAGKPVRLKLEILNKGSLAARGVSVQISTPNPGVSIEPGALTVAALDAGRRALAAEELRFTVSDPEREIVSFQVRLRDVSGAVAEVPLYVPLFPDAPVLSGIRVLDGATVSLWHHAIEHSEQSLGTGNGDGVMNPGETIAIAVPDGDAFRAVELFSSDPCVNLDQRLSDPWGAYDHVGNSAKISLARISPGCPDGHEIPFFARYWVPNKPEHALKQGIVRVRVTTRVPR